MRVLAPLLLSSALLAGCSPTPDRTADCEVQDCSASWGRVGASIWDCGEGNEDEILINPDYISEGPFPTQSQVQRLPCGTDVSEELGFVVGGAHAFGPGCTALGIPEDRVGASDVVCEGGTSDDDDSAL